MYGDLVIIYHKPYSIYLRGTIVYRPFPRMLPPRMENQMEKKMEKEIETPGV